MYKILYSIILTTLSVICFSQTWPRIYGDNIDTGPRKVIETYDKGYLIISNIYISDYYRYIWLIKTDINGEIIWDKKIGEGSYRYYIDDINQTYDGGYILIFRCSKYDVDEDPVVMKLDACAEIEWCTTLHSDGYNRGVKVIQTPDSNYLALSMYHSPQPAERIFLFKLNQSGEVIWSHLYAQLEPGIFNEEGFDLTIFENDSSYLITGGCDFIPTGGSSAFWIKISKEGDEVKNIIWNDSTSELSGAFQTVHKFNDFYSSGTKPYGNVFNATIFKLNNNGEKLDSRRILNEDSHTSGTTLSMYKDTLFIVGTTWKDLNPPYSEHCKIYLTDTSGNIIHNRTLFDDLQAPRNTQVTYDDKILVMCGFYFGSGWDIYFYKLNQYLEDDTLYNIQLTYDSLCPGTIISDTMTINCGIWVDVDEIIETNRNNNLKIFPNPARDRVRIVLPEYLMSEEIINGFSVKKVIYQYHGKLSLIIYDGYGREVEHIEIPKKSKSIDFNVSGMNNGLHIAVLYLDCKIIDSGKFIVEN